MSKSRCHWFCWSQQGFSWRPFETCSELIKIKGRDPEKFKFQNTVWGPIIGRTPEGTLQALNERRVQTLILAPDFDEPGRRCPADDMLVTAESKRCPADGGETREIEHLREAVVEQVPREDPDPVAAHLGDAAVAVAVVH